MLPKLVITDIDGVWTDGGMYYTEQGDLRERRLGSYFPSQAEYTCSHYDG